MVAPTIRAMLPSRDRVSSARSGSSSMPNASETASRKARWASVILCGHSYAPIRATAAASSVTALSSCRNEPWPAEPSAIRLSQAIPFSAVWTR